MDNMIFYDCYDENKKFITQVFARDCVHLLQLVPDVKYVLGIDYVTRRAQWMKVDPQGLSFAGWRDKDCRMFF